jgi:hypothetical protein
MAITSGAIEGKSPEDNGREELRQSFGQKDFLVEYEQIIRGSTVIRAESAADAHDNFSMATEGQVALKVINIRET